MKLFLGHDPDTDLEGFPGEGVDLLLTIHDNAPEGKALELAVRPGRDMRSRIWSPPTLLDRELS